MPANSDSCACGSKWRLPVLLAIVLAAILLSQNRAIRDAVIGPAKEAHNERAGSASAERVTLTIDFGDRGPRQAEVTSWSEGMTVGDLLNRVRRLSVAQQGSGASAFVTQINGVTNEGAGGRNWIYSVNGKAADRSLGIYELRPNDHVLWTFTGGD